MLRTQTITFALAMMTAAMGQDAVPSPENLKGAYPSQEHDSSDAGRSFPTQVFWGDTHLHTGMSMPDGVPTITQELAYTSPTRYSPGLEMKQS